MFSVKNPEIGEHVVEVFFNDTGEQLPGAPFIVDILPRICDSSSRYPGSNGECLCKSGHVKIGGDCVPLGTFVPFIVVPILLYVYVFFAVRQTDSVWTIEKEELQFGEPPEVLGRCPFDP